MLQYIQGGFAPIPYKGFKKARAASNTGFTAWEDENIVVLTIASPKGAPLICIVDKATADYTDFQATIGQKDSEGEYVYANRPVEREEIRFQTHDYSDKATWSSETTGDIAAWYAGGVMRHPLSDQWIDSTGAAMLAQYDPQDPLTLGALFGSMAYAIDDLYDDVNFRWYDANGNVLCWLDQSGAAEKDDVWRRSSDNAVIVKYVHPALDPQDPEYDSKRRDGDWYRAEIDGNGDISWVLDQAHVVTSSRWRILPYADTKIVIHEAWLSADAESIVPGPLHYRAFGYAEKDPDGNVIPGGIYKGRDWLYESLAMFRAGANTFPMVEPLTLTGHSSPVLTMGYDYSKTVYQVLDSKLQQRLDIETENHTRVTNTFSAKATFVALKVESY